MPRLVTALACPSPQYLAGFFDGEGCTCVEHAYRPERFQSPETAYAISVSLSNTYKPIIEAIHRKYGGWVGSNGNHRIPGHRMAHQWKATGATAGRFLTDVEPFLVEKRQRAVAALFYCDTVRWPKDWRRVPKDGVHLRGLVLRYMEANPNVRGTDECRPV